MVSFNQQRENIMTNANINLIIETVAEDYDLPLHKVEALAKQYDPRTTDFHVAVENLAYMTTDALGDANEIDEIFEALAKQRDARNAS